MKFEEMTQAEKDKCVRTYWKATIEWARLKHKPIGLLKDILDSMEKSIEDEENKVITVK